jgi:hypothetical protein
MEADREAGVNRMLSDYCPPGRFHPARPATGFARIGCTCLLSKPGTRFEPGLLAKHPRIADSVRRIWYRFR